MKAYIIIKKTKLLYCLSKKSRHIFFSTLLYKSGQDFFLPIVRIKEQFLKTSMSFISRQWKPGLPRRQQRQLAIGINPTVATLCIAIMENIHYGELVVLSGRLQWRLRTIVHLSIILSSRQHKLLSVYYTILYVQRGLTYLYSKLSNKMGQNFLDIQYSAMIQCYYLCYHSYCLFF